MTFRQRAGCGRFAVTILTTVALLGCSGEYGMMGRAASMPRAERFHGFNQPQPSADPVMAEAAEQAEQLTRAIAQGAAPASTGGPPVRWIDARHATAREDMPRSKPVVSLDPNRPIYVTPPTDIAPAPQPQPQATVQPVKAAPAQVAPQVDPAQTLIDRIRNSNDPAVVKAMRGACLSVVNGEAALPPALLADLNPMQRQTVQQYHQLLTSLSNQIAAGGDTVDADAIVSKLDGMFGRQPIRIANASLCTRVDNFGVYEPFGSTTFLAGREQPMILYLELENFHTETVEGLHEVRLEQDVVLYNESDGLAVWRVPAETIIDRSRNRRRDFFTVKMLHLPARLGVGKFQLKVRVKDLGGLTVDERNIPIHLVADQSLVSMK